MSKVYIAGITGFLGSNIARYLVEKGHDIIATYRTESSRKHCKDFQDKINWILNDDFKWIEQIITYSPEIVINAAWIGVKHEERNNWEIQITNLELLKNLLFICRNSPAKKFIGMGSQAEYGLINGCIDETYKINPTEAYGNVKVICSEYCKQFCSHFKIDWYWLRLFSFFGRGESENWLIPSIIKKILANDQILLTEGEQKYSYLYAHDLGIAINKILSLSGRSGIYNLSGKNSISLKSLIKNIRNEINPLYELEFGSLPYRQEQSMHIQGNSSKFIKEFGDFETSDFNESLITTIQYYKKQYSNNEGI